MSDEPGKLLAEWFWVDRWTGSSAFGLSAEARGVYREMLSQAWRRGARLPNDHETICRFCALTSGEWERSWPKIERYWRVDGEYLVNDTQVEVYADALGRHERASSRGRKGAQALAQARLKQPLKHQPPSPSPSLSLTPNDKQPSSPSPPGSAVEMGSKRPKQEPTERERLVARLASELDKALGCRMPAKCRVEIAALFDQHGFDEARVRAAIKDKARHPKRPWDWAKEILGYSGPNGKVSHAPAPPPLFVPTPPPKDAAAPEFIHDAMQRAMNAARDAAKRKGAAS